MKLTRRDYNYKFTCLQEACDSLVLAHTNLMSLHITLQNVKLPHTKIEDLEALEKRTSQMFNNLNNMSQLLDFIESLRSKTVTQHKWVKEVLNKTIKNDLVEVRDKCRSKSHELRFERAMLIKQRQELWQQEIEPIKEDSPFDLRGKYLLCDFSGNGCQDKRLVSPQMTF